MRNLLFTSALLALLAIGAAACDGSVTGNTGGGGSGTTSSSGTTTSTTGTGGTVPGGDCASDADCGGSPCAPITPGGYKTCLKTPPEATACHMPPGPIADVCCSSAECMGGGKCYLSTQVPYCGGVAMPEYNTCVGDACTDDKQCSFPGVPGAVCLPQGAFSQPGRVCLAAHCKTDADCTAKAGGRCAPITSICCSMPSVLACVYPGGCQTDTDCGPNLSQHCEVKDGQAQCVPGATGCPA